MLQGARSGWRNYPTHNGRVDIVSALRDRTLLGAGLTRPGASLESWTPWFVFLRALFGLGLDDPADLALYQQSTGRARPPTDPVREAVALCGRRGGKTRIGAALGVYLALFKSYRDVLAPGEVGTVPLLAVDREQAGIALRYAKGFLDSSPTLAARIRGTTADSIELEGLDGMPIRLQVATTSYRSVRGTTAVAAIADEIAFWRSDDSASPDREVLNALRPALATTGGLLVMLSTRYRRAGVAYERWRAHWGVEASPVLVWSAPTLQMNATVPAHVVEAALADDPVAAASEYGEGWRDDVTSLLPADVLEAAVDVGITERPPEDGVHYSGFLDPSGGASDSFTAGVAHVDADGRLVLDALVEEPPPFAPSEAVARMVDLFNRYRVGSATADRWGGGWVVEAFAAHGVHVEQSAAPKSELYLDIVPQFSNRNVRLLDRKKLLVQFSQLERRTTRSGKDSVDHPARGGHDDCCNACTGALLLAAANAGNAMPTAVGLAPEEYEPLRWRPPLLLH